MRSRYPAPFEFLVKALAGIIVAATYACAVPLQRALRQRGAESRGSDLAAVNPRPPLYKGPKLLCMLKKQVGLQLTEGSASNGKLQKRWRTCAVVSSSGVLKKHELGQDIDSADLVIRFNNAPLAKFTSRVGHKEGLRFVNGELSEYIARFYTNKTINAKTGISYAVVPMGAKPDLDALQKKFPGVEWFQLDGSMPKKFRVLLEDVYWADRWVFHEGRGSVTATSGAMGMITALSICDEVRGYGMAASKTMHDAPYHYYDTEGKANKNYFHKSFNIEKDLWRRLATNKPADIDERDVVIIPGFSHAKCQ